jgi:hypothetical protein
MTRTQTVLAVLLAVQVAILAVLSLTGSGEAGPRSAEALLPALDGLKPSRLVIDGADDEEVELRRQDGAWTLPEAGGYPVDGGKVDTLLADLEKVQVRRPVVTSPRYHAQLKVTEDEHERRVRIWGDADGEPAADLLVGTSPNYRISHVRRAGEDDVYEAMGLSTWDLRPDAAAWIDKKLIDLPADQVTALALSNEHGTFELRKIDGSWTLAQGDAGGKALRQSEVDSLVRAFAALYLADPVGRVDAAAQGLDEPVAVVTLTSGGAPAPAGEATEAAGDPAGENGDGAEASPESDGGATEPARVTVLKVGALKDEESGQRYATLEDFGFAVTLNKFDAERATDKKLDDLLEAEGG